MVNGAKNTVFRRIICIANSYKHVLFRLTECYIIITSAAIRILTYLFEIHRLVIFMNTLCLKFYIYIDCG